MHALSLDIEPPRIRLMPPTSDRRSPTEPSLHGVAAGIDDVLRRQDVTNRSVSELAGSVGELEAKVVHHGVEIRELKEAHHELAALVGEQADLLDEHGEKLEEVARLRHPPQSLHRTAPGATLVPVKTPSIPPLAEIGKPTGHKSGSYTVGPEAWDILNDRIQKVEQQAHDDRIRAEAAEATLKRVKESSDRTIRILSFCLAVAVACGAVIGFVWKLHG